MSLAKHFVNKPGTTPDLGAIDPGDTSRAGTKADAKESLLRDAEAIDALQDRLFAERKRALLVILQGMDTSGKDGTIKRVFNATGPHGVTVTSFGRPSPQELAHDFLWRVHAACPQRGIIGVFNRSHYEDVLVGKVRSLVEPKVIEHRYEQINAFEDLISSSTRVLKIMLHISKDEQRERLQARLNDPHKHWKFDPGDLDDRARWDEYMAAYETVLARTSTEVAPWYVVPADHKWARNAIVAGLVRATLADMDPRYPEAAFDVGSVKIV